MPSCICQLSHSSDECPKLLLKCCIKITVRTDSIQSRRNEGGLVVQVLMPEFFFKRSNALN